MLTLNKTDTRTFWKLADMAIANGGHIRIDNSTAFMYLAVEKIGPDAYSFAHYGEQNGDAMRDPDVVFYAPDRLTGVMPVSYRNDYLGVWKEYTECDSQGRPSKINVRGVEDLVRFCKTWIDEVMTWYKGV